MQKASGHQVHWNFVPQDRSQGAGDRSQLTLLLTDPCFLTPGPFLKVQWTWLPHIVCNRFQVLFHSLNKGSFHRSLAVLVHYRLPTSI